MVLLSFAKMCSSNSANVPWVKSRIQKEKEEKRKERVCEAREKEEEQEDERKKMM